MSYHGRIVKMFGGCHACYDGFLGTAIMVSTTWFWSWFKRLKVPTHASIGFQYEDGYEEIFEAREGKSWQGPIPVAKVEAWALRNPKKRAFRKYYYPSYFLSEDEMQMKFRQCVHNLEIWTYSIKQLPRMGIRKILFFLPMRPTPNAVVCSEAATIISEPQIDILGVLGVKSADLVTPYLFEKACKLICTEGISLHKPADVSDAYSN